MFLNCRGWEYLLLWWMTLNLSGVLENLWGGWWFCICTCDRAWHEIASESLRKGRNSALDIQFIGVGIGGARGARGAMAPPTIWLIAGQRAQDTAYQQIFHRPDWVNLWNFMNKQLNSMLYLNYCSFYSQESSCLTCHAYSLVDAKMGVVWRKCGCGQKIARAAIFWPLQPYTCSYAYAVLLSQDHFLRQA